MPRVTFLPSGKTIEVEAGEYLLEAALTAGLPVWQQCGNVAVCGWCRMKVIKGKDNLSAVERQESRLAEREKFAADERASCQTVVFGDVTVTTPYWCGIEE